MGRPCALALQAASRLGNAIDRLLHDANQWPARGVVSWSARRRQAVDDLSLEEFALQIGGDIVDASDTAALACGVGEEPAR